ncbi:MAG: shikimate dehydrogenase [Bacteroidales bacterium]|nr:shikimate dehydrogenase [Bacteroidales bacterium]
MREFGLIGKTLKHSFSQKYFEEKFKREQITDASYSLFELTDIKQLTEFIRQRPQLVGFNVTIPYKQQFIPYLDELSEEAAAVNAVNTVVIERVGGQILTKGHNTDIIGFRESLREVDLPKQALVLGTGGAAEAVTYVLENLGCRCTAISRDPQRGLPYSALNADIIRQHKFIVNCTPLGTYPNINEKPDIPYEGLSGEHFLYDLVYNPSETAFLKEGILRGAKVQNGLQMLHAQAEASWRIWNN